MKKIFSLFAAALMSAVMFAGNLVPGDTILWTKGDATEVFGEGTNANGNRWRDLAYYDGVVYAIAHSQDASGNPRIYKFDAETGSYLGNMDVSAVWGGDIALASLQILDNGEVIAMGCRVASATSAVPIYYWDSVQGVSHELMRATIANGGKRVEMLHYEGTLADGKIYLAAEKCDTITVIPVVNKAVVADQISYITLTSGTTKYIGYAPRVINVTDTTISICSSTKCMTYKISDGSCLTWTDLTGANQEGGNGVAFFEYNNEKYWATVKMGNVSAATLANACVQVQTYTGFGRWGASGVVQKYCSAADVLPSAERNLSFTTGVAVRVNEDGYSVWACSVNHGIIAYRYVNPVDYKITVNTTAAGNFQITSANCTDVLNDGGSFKFDNATKTITLTNCHFTSNTYPLIINQSVNIVLVGENSITSTISATALKFASGDATIGGGGKLTLSCLNTGGADGIYCPGGNLTINECEIYAEGGYGIEGGSTRTLTINPGAKVTAYGPSKGSFTGWSSIVLGEGVEILSPAGAQIVGGDVKDAEGALLKSQVVIGAPAEETIPATSVTLDQDTLKMYMGVGTATLKATVLPDNTTDFVEWSVVEGGESFVSVLSGIVTALAEGEAKVVAKAGDVADTCVVVVGPAPVEYGIQVYNPAKDDMLNVNSLNCADIFGDGKLSYDPEEKVLTLNNLVMDCGGYYGIINNDVDGLTVKLLGDNVLVGHNATALRLYTNTTIAGGGKLTASSENNDGCYISSGTLTINACELVMQGQWGLEGGGSTSLIINEGAHITAIGTSSTGMSDGSIKGYGSITLNGVQILSPAGAQIIGGTVYDAEGAVLKTEVVIGTPAPIVEPTADRRIFAYDLRMTEVEGVCTFDFKTNIAPTEANIVLYNGDAIVDRKAVTVSEALTYSVPVNKADIVAPEGTTLTWGVEVKAGKVEDFGMVFNEGAMARQRMFIAMDKNTESPYFGRIYSSSRATSTDVKAVIYGVDGSIINDNAFTLGNAARPGVDDEGTIYWADYADAHSGIWVMNPETFATEQLFDYDECVTVNDADGSDNKGLLKKNGVAMCGSTMCAEISGKGADTKLWISNEDAGVGTGLQKQGLVMVKLGQEDGSIAHTWATAPTWAPTLSHNAGSCFDMQKTERGMWWCQNRGINQNLTANRSLMFINNDGEIKWVSDNTDVTINGSNGGGMEVNADESVVYMVDGTGNIMVMNIAWNEDVPTLSLDTTYETSFSHINTIVLDPAGNLVTSSGAYGTNMRLVIYGMPTDSNAIIIPAAKSQVITLPKTHMFGSYMVGGEGADFASLYAACDSVNKAVIAGNVAGDIQLLIAADLEERNCAIVNNTDYTVTIRPDQDVKRTITFTATTDANAGPSGALMVGVHMANNIQHTDTIPTKNVIIDGLAFEGATNKMEITTVSNFHNSGYLVVFYGPVRNSAIKNCIITNNRTSGSTYGVTLRTMNANVGHSDGVLVEGNEITCTASGAGQCIYFCAANAAETEVPVNCIIRNNILTAKSRGVFLNGEKDIIIDGNEFHINGGVGFLASGIYGNKNYGSIKVINNHFVEMTTADNGATSGYGMTGILASGGGTFTIENNFFGGLDATCTAQPTRLVSVRCGSPCIVRHNTFVMDELTGTPSTELLSANPISCLYLAANGMTVQNNIFVSYETVAHNSLIRGTMTEDMTGNLFYIDAEEQGNAVIVDGATPAATFADLPAEIQAKSINAPIELVKGYMVAESSLGNRAFGVPAIEGILTDIDGADRHAPMAFVGCYEAEDINALPLYATLAEAVEGKTIRRAVADQEAVYVLAIDAQKAPTLVKADFEGNIITEYATDFCTTQTISEAGSMILSDIALTADGVLLGINGEHNTTTRTIGQSTLLYKWNADGSGALLVDFENVIGSANNPVAGNFGNATTDMLAFSGTLADGVLAVRAMTQGSGNRSRIGLFKFADGAIIKLNTAKDLASWTATSGIYMTDAPTAGNFVWSATGVSTVEFASSVAIELSEPEAIAATATMDAAYDGISGFSFAKGGNAIDWMIVPAADGATILDVTSGLATATEVEELTAQAIDCDFMFAALVGEAGAKKVMLMRDADIELLDINTQPVYTNLNEVKADAKAVKVMRNGHVFIIRDGKMFNMQGMIVK